MQLSATAFYCLHATTCNSPQLASLRACCCPPCLLQPTMHATACYCLHATTCCCPQLSACLPAAAHTMPATANHACYILRPPRLPRLLLPFRYQGGDLSTCVPSSRWEPEAPWLADSAGAGAPGFGAFLPDIDLFDTAAFGGWGGGGEGLCTSLWQEFEVQGSGFRVQGIGLVAEGFNFFVVFLITEFVLPPPSDLLYPMTCCRHPPLRGSQHGPPAAVSRGGGPCVHASVCVGGTTVGLAAAACSHRYCR